MLMLFAAMTLMPMPARVTPGQGRLLVDSSFHATIAQGASPRLTEAVRRMAATLSRKTGIPFIPSEDAQSAQLVVQVAAVDTQPLPKLGDDESYTLTVESSRARLNAPTYWGALRGLETFLQLVQQDQQGFAAPACGIQDQPRFPWRGLHLDVSRHWLPSDIVKRNLDGMAAVKLNVFHWHLSDNQGFRVESLVFPKLQGMGSDGNFYTQAEIRDIIQYAGDRGIRVVPEFDIPGHATAMLVGYPELGAAPGPYEIGRHWGIFDPAIDPTKEAVYPFLDQFIGEMAKLFPDEYFHIGGDEVNGRAWKASPTIQQYMKDQGLKSNDSLQAYFNRRVQGIVSKHGKRMEGWDEILNPDLPKSIVIQSWRGPKSLADAVKLGYSGILSSGYYLDHIYPAATHYQVDPLENGGAGLTEEQKKRVLGGEAAMWTEYVDAENVDSRIWPRTAAIAERLWSPASVNDIESMYQRLEITSRELEFVGLTHRSNYRPMLERLAGDNPVEPLQVLADVVEPTKLYTRGRAHKYTQFTPLNRLVDAARPESDVARRFTASMNRAEQRQILSMWRDNDARLRPAIQKQFLLNEVAPLSADLSAVAQIGLEALDFLDGKGKPAAGWAAEKKAALDKAAKPKAELLLMAAPAVQKLVDQAARR